MDSNTKKAEYLRIMLQIGCIPKSARIVCKSFLSKKILDVIIVSLLSKVMKEERQVLIANSVKLSILNILTSFKITLNGSGEERKN